MVSQQFNTSGFTELTLQFKLYLIDHWGGYTIGFQSTSDGVNWNNIDVANPGGNIGPGTFSTTFSNPDVGSDTFQLAILFSGSSNDLNYCYIDDISLSGFPAAAPAAPTNFTLTPDAGGDWEAELNWICPDLDTSGNALTDLDEMRVYRDNIFIFADTTSVIGAAGSYTDDAVPYSGYYSYSVVGYNDSVEGISVSATDWIGEDSPASVQNLALEQPNPMDLIAYLTWDNPTTGLNGGPFNEPILGYHIRRSDGVTFELQGYMSDFTDDTIPDVGYYSYQVRPYNSIGDGALASSNYLYFNNVGLPFFDNFDDGMILPEWTLVGWGVDSWTISNTNTAGGTAPELRFDNDPLSLNSTTLLSPEFNTTVMTELTLEFNHYIDYFSSSMGTVGFSSTSDGGQTWNDVIIFPPGSNPGPETVTYSFSNSDVGSTNFQLSIFVTGIPVSINYWYVDDIMLSQSFGSIEGNVQLFGGNGNIGNVSISIDDILLNPDINGDYSITIPPGIYTVTAALEGYNTITIDNVVVEAWQVTNLDVELYWISPELDPPENLFVDNFGYAIWNAPGGRDDTRQNKKGKSQKDNSRDLLGYNVYLNGSLAGFTSENYWQLDQLVLVVGQEYETAVETIYDDGASIKVYYDWMYYPNVLSPPESLFVTTDGYATWTTPPSEELQGYNLYLDSTFVSFTSELFFDYDDGTLINGQSYTAAVSAVYDSGESDPIDFQFDYILPIPENLFVDDYGYATWDESGVTDLSVSIHKKSSKIGIRKTITTENLRQESDSTNHQTAASRDFLGYNV
jgi:hypothetical protein